MSAPDPWALRRSDRDLADRASSESLFALANGTLGVRGGCEEGASASQGCFLAGVWERSAIHYHERFTGFAAHTDTRLPVADACRIRVWLGAEQVNPDAAPFHPVERELDLRNGCLRRTLRWRAAAGGSVEIVAERVVPLDTPALLAIRYRVRSIDYRGPIRLESAIDTTRGAAAQGDDPRIGATVDGGLQTHAGAATAELAWVAQHTCGSAIRLVCAQAHRLPGAAGLTHGAASYAPAGAIQTFHGELQPGASVVLEKFATWTWSDPGADAETDPVLLAGAKAALATAGQAGFPSLLAGQAERLQTLWATADLAIDGAPDVAQALRFNLFQLFQSGPRSDACSMAAKGLTGEGYEGHCFWDTEAFALPALVQVAPDVARHLLVWRYRTLDRARAHARELDHPHGALYAWRTISGDECSAYFPGGSAQYHINAAIAWAVRLYVDITGDDGFLRTMGAEMLFETARIWMAIGHHDARRGGAFCLCEVTGPDEYSALVDNNHYTNRMAQRHLRDAVATAQWLAQRFPADYSQLSTRIGLQADELAAWQRAADAMYLPVDAALGVFPQDDGFLDKPRLDAADMRDPALRPLLLHRHPLTIYRHQVCKQADVVLALMLAGEAVHPAAKRRNFDYYEPLTLHDSTLSASTFSVVASEVGYAEKAYRYFLDTLRVDLDDLHGNAAHGLHMAAMAGSWLALTWGFGGLRVSGAGLALAPRLPQAWHGYRFAVGWHDARLRVEVGADAVRYTLLHGNELAFTHHGQPQHLRAGESLTLPNPAPPRAVEAVIFDLDGVLADTARLHRAAWRELAEEIGAPFDDDLAERMKGVDRMGSLELLLARAPRRYDATEKAALAARKNARYVALISQLGPHDLLPGARAALLATRRAGLKTALASASRNAPLLIERLGITGLFDHVVDAGHIAHSKPHPEIFLAAAAGLGVAPAACLGVEDAAAGI
ncbi:MAG TPA: beta-phosphoglucomutase, partial [Rhodanobacter sp.]|nr:beta-phosphoglucomutase [Rhodanobacter sp.]